MRIARLWRILAALSGLLFVLAFILGIGVGGPPPGSDPTGTSEAIAAALLEYRSNVVTGSYILLFAVFLLVFFAGYLRHVAQPEEGDTWPQSAAFGGAIVAAAVITLIALVGIAQGQLEDYGPDPVIARTLITLNWSGVWVVSPGFAALIGATTLSASRYGYLPRFIGVLGATTTVLLLTPFWGFGLIGTLLWLGWTSGYLALRELRPADE